MAYVYLIITVFSACERIEEAIFFSWSTRRFFVTYVSSRVFWVLGARQIFFCIVIRQKIMSSLDAALSTSRPGPKASPQMTIASLTLATATKAITVKEALLKAGYQEDEISRARIKAASKRKCRIVNDVLSKKKKAKRSEYYVNARIKINRTPLLLVLAVPVKHPLSLLLWMYFQNVCKVLLTNK